MLKRLEVLC